MPAPNITDNRKITKDKIKIAFDIISTKYNEALDSAKFKAQPEGGVIFKVLLKKEQSLV